MRHTTSTTTTWGIYHLTLSLHTSSPSKSEHNCRLLLDRDRGANAADGRKNARFLAFHFHHRENAICTVRMTSVPDWPALGPRSVTYVSPRGRPLHHSFPTHSCELPTIVPTSEFTPTSLPKHTLYLHTYDLRIDPPTSTLFTSFLAPPCTHLFHDPTTACLHNPPSVVSASRSTAALSVSSPPVQSPQFLA
jgi:hypothetical protein